MVPVVFGGVVIVWGIRNPGAQRAIPFIVEFVVEGPVGHHPVVWVGVVSAAGAVSTLIEGVRFIALKAMIDPHELVCGVIRVVAGAVVRRGEARDPAGLVVAPVVTGDEHAAGFLVVHADEAA